jgi:hypothetical protein
MLKDVEILKARRKVIEHIKEQHSDSVVKEKILEKLEKIEDREYNVSDITIAAGLVY